MMKPLAEALQGFLVADGAMGTQLLARGLGAECPEACNVEHADAVRAVHEGYIAAGARLVLTNTFGASEWKLERSGHAADQERFCRAAAENARTAAVGRDVYVLGDVGPTGELPEPYGAHPVEAFERVFAAQVEVLAAAGVHGVIVETMGSAVEAAAAVRAAKRSCGLPVLGCLTFTAGNRGYRTMMGETVAQGAETLQEAGADVVGSNCGLGAGPMAEVVRELRAAADGPILAKPNAGQPKLVDGRTVFDEGPAAWAAQVPALAGAGATIVGGCCGTTPEHIARACELLNEVDDG
jgi:5-methyltetrahydrofolate--homocysteine methyltransferase